MKINQPAPVTTPPVGGSTPAVSGDRPSQEKNQQLLAACQEFESIFWHQVLRQMRSSIPKSGFLDGGPGEEIFQDFLDEEYSRLLAQRGPGSMAQQLYRQLEGAQSFRKD